LKNLIVPFWRIREFLSHYVLLSDQEMGRANAAEASQIFGKGVVVHASSNTLPGFRGHALSQAHRHRLYG
jgi:hypothetical protein